ncbi:phage tail tape measure protein [Arthrobacter sp. SD76]|uniref:phage tail tape measure protein n=1 Tax=Arthrobacter sp. SD76 TaxID=3415007 RepID=UPI003C729EA3
MSVRSVIVRLEAEVAGYVAGLGKAAQATEDVVKKTAQAKKTIGENRQAMDTAGTALAGFGATSVAALGASAKAAMDWESAWAGVTKTVDGSPEQMAALEGELRNLAKTLPSTHQDIAAVAEAAGQLGVQRESVAAFTKTMIDLAETTNLTADDAATSIARFMNVMGTAGDEVDNLGATLVALGNDGASTEKDIMMMAQRISGAGKLVGASEADVLALANALSSVGVEAELGGGVTSRVLQRMYADVKTGGEGLQALAKVAGTSSEQFAAAFENDPVRAMDMVVKGLSRVKESGGNVVETMSDLGIKGTEETGVILRLAGAGDLLSESLDLGAKAWKENTALANEAAKRYETTESKVKIAWNNIKDAAIDAGASMLPIIQGAAEAVAGLAQTFGSLPAPVQGAVTGFAAVTGGAALLAGALVTVVPKIADTRAAFKTMSDSGSKVPGVMAGIGKAAGVAAAAYTALATAAAFAAAATDDNRTKTSVEDFNNALTGISQNGAAARKALDAAFNGVLNPDLISGGTTAVNTFGDALNRVFNASWQDNVADFGSTLFGQNATSGINAAKDAIGNFDKAIASMATSGNLEDAAASFRLAAEDAGKTGVPVEKLVELFPEYKDAVLAAKSANGETQVSQEALTEAMLQADPAAQNAASAQAILDEAIQGTGVALDGVIEDMDKFLEQLFATGMITMSARDANAAYHEALRNIPATLKEIAESGGEMGAILNENGTDFNLATEAGARANAAFQDVARKGMAEVEAKAKEGVGLPDLQAKLSTTYDDLLVAADGMGITGQAAIDLAREVLGVPDGVDIHSWMDDRAKRMAEETKGAMDAIDGRTVTVTTRDIKIEETHRINYEKRVADSGGNEPEGGGLYGSYASGGAVTGPGTSTSDTAGLFALSNGEHVLDAGDVQKMGGQQAVYKFRAQLQAGQFQGFAGGGAIGTRTASAQLMTLQQAAPTVSLEGLTVLVTNPFTGEQVRGLVSATARQQATDVVQTFDANTRNLRKG